MSSLDKLFANSLKNDITHTFVESVEAIMFLEGISSEDFLRTNHVKVFTPILEEPSFLNSRKKLTITDKNYQADVDYDILSVWLYKLSENLRRIYSAKKKNNDFSNLIEQQNNLYTLSNYFLDYWDTQNEPSFFPRAIFGRHMDYLAPLDYLIYLGTHDCLTSENFAFHLKIVDKFSDKLDLEDIPDFIPKLALSSKNSKLFKTILPKFSHDSLLNTLQYHKSSDGFTILSVEYILENPSLFNLYDYQKTDIVNMLLHKDILLSKHFDDFILDKNEFLNQLSNFITPDITKNIEIVFVNKSKKNPQYKNFLTVFLKNQKKINPYSLIHELKSLSFEEIQDSYALSTELISDTIDRMVELSNLKQNQHKDYLFSSFHNFVQKLHPVLEKQHLAKIISLNSEFLSFCKPVYLHLKLQEKYPTKSEQGYSLEKKIKI